MPRGKPRPWPSLDRALVYQAFEDWTGCTKASWTVRRLAQGYRPLRLPFRGTREEAEAEAAKLNALAGLAEQEILETPSLMTKVGAWTGPEAVHPFVAGRPK